MARSMVLTELNATNRRWVLHEVRSSSPLYRGRLASFTSGTLRIGFFPLNHAVAGAQTPPTAATCRA